GAQPQRHAGDLGSPAAPARRTVRQGPDPRDAALGVGIMTMKPLLLAEYTATSCIGRGVAPTLTALIEQRSGLARCEFETVKIDTHVGEVPGVDAQRLPKALQIFDCRNNRLAELAVHQDGFFDAVQAAAARWGRRRVGVFIGTSTAGIMQT